MKPRLLVLEVWEGPHRCMKMEGKIKKGYAILLFMLVDLEAKECFGVWRECCAGMDSSRKNSARRRAVQ